MTIDAAILILRDLGWKVEPPIYKMKEVTTLEEYQVEVYNAAIVKYGYKGVYKLAKELGVPTRNFQYTVKKLKIDTSKVFNRSNNKRI